MAADWTEEENDAIVADYFAMLGADVAGRLYKKAEHNRRLQSVVGRSRGSIEFKHRNISAVLKGLGEVWIPGYKPAFNFRASLVEAVVLWLERNPGWIAHTRATGLRTPATATCPRLTDGDKLRGEAPLSAARANPRDSQRHATPIEIFLNGNGRCLSSITSI